jgi:hypothetical protein
MGVPPGNSSRGTAGLVSVPERYVAGADIRQRQEGWPYLWSQQVIHEISGLCQRMVSDQPPTFRKRSPNKRPPCSPRDPLIVGRSYLLIVDG